MTRHHQSAWIWVWFGLTILPSRGELEGEVPETVVTAEGIRVGIQPSESKISAEEIQKWGAVSLPELLQREPGVSVPFDVAGVDPLVPYLQGGSQSINIRGMEGNRVRILVDGVPQPDDFVARSFLGSGGPGRVYFDPAVFASFDLSKSARPGTGAIAGTVSGETESPWSLLGESLEGRRWGTTSTYATSNRSWNQRAAAAMGDGTWASSLVYSGRWGHELEANGSLKANPATVESQAAVWKSVWRANSWTIEPTVEFFGSQSFSDLDSLEGDSLIGRTLEATNDAERERWRASLAAHYQPPTPQWFGDRLKGGLFYQQALSENLNRQNLQTPAGGLRNRTNDLGYRTKHWGWNFSTEWERAEHLWTLHYDGGRRDISGSLRRQDNGGPILNLPNLAPSVVWDHGMSVSKEWSPNERWKITPALRLSSYAVNPTNTPEFLAETAVPIFDEFGRFIGERSIEAVDYEAINLSPSLHLSFEARDDLTIFASYTRGFRNPTAEELAGVFVHPDNLSISLPNPDLEAEMSHSFDFGMAYDRDEFSWKISSYLNRYGNFLESNVPTGEVIDGLEVLRTENTRDAEIYGFEAKGEWNHGGFRLGGALAWSRGTSKDGPVNSIEPWKVVSYLGFDHPEEKWGWELTGTFVAEKEQSDILGDLPPTDAYFLLDLIGYYRIGDHAFLRGGIKNLFDESYTLWSRANRGSGHGGGVVNSRDTQPGINAFLSVELEF